LVQNTKTGKNITNDHKLYQMAAKYLNQKAIKFEEQPFQLQDPPRLTQFWILDMKNTIWQP
jgi:hypothetical protein